MATFYNTRMGRVEDTPENKALLEKLGIKKRIENVTVKESDEQQNSGNSPRAKKRKPAK